MNVKKECAKLALTYIKNGSVIGLGGGSTVGYLINYIKDSHLDVKIVTPSFKTKLLCIEASLEVLPTFAVHEVDIAFDGCDQVDENLYALKSAGGIHTQEKLIAHMAKEYILLVDETKVVPALTFEHPIVLEVLPESLHYVLFKADELASKVEVRISNQKDGYIITDNGNYLIDLFVQGETDSVKLEQTLKQIPGVIDVSLFTTVVTKAIVTSVNGMKVITKNKVEFS